MGMPKTPNQLEAESMRRAEQAETATQEPETISMLKDGQLPPVVTLRNVLRGWHWAGYNKVFQVLEIVCPTDRAFERARKQVLDVANDQERTMAAIVSRFMADKDKVKENSNGSEKPQS